MRRSNGSSDGGWGGSSGGRSDVAVMGTAGPVND